MYANANSKHAIRAYVTIIYWCRAKRVLESRHTADEDRISELEQNVVEAKEAATTSEQLLLEVRHALVTTATP